MSRVAVYDEVREAVAQRLQQAIAETRQPLRLGRRLAVDDLAGGSETNRLEDILGAGPQAAFVAGAADLGLYLDSLPDVEGTNPLRRIELVAGHRQEVNTEIAHIHRHLADRLRRIGVDRHPAFAAQGRHFSHRLQGTDLVVGQHQGHQNGVVAQGVLHGLRIDPTESVDPHDGQRDAALDLEGEDHLEHRRMLHCRGDYVAASAGLDHAADGQVVRLRAA